MVKECRYFTWTQFEHPTFSLLAFYWLYNLADKNIFLKRLQENLMQTMRKIWISSSIFTLNDRSGPNTCNSSCPVKLSNFLSLIAWASRSTLDSLTVHFTEQKKTSVVHGSLLLLRILFTELVVLILTNKGLLKTISWHIMQLIKAKCHETKT